MFRNNQMIAGVVFLIIWIIGLLVWGASKNIKPDLSNNYEDYNTRGIGHSLWND